MNWVSAFDEYRKVAEEYIKQQSLEDFYWVNKWPYISSEREFFNDNDKQASYIEYKVSCKENKDCWYVIVNIDNSDASIPISSSYWKTLSEIMNWWNLNSKNYYFWPFEQFSENEKTWEINFTNPDNNIIKENHKNFSFLSEKSNYSKNDFLKAKLDSLKKISKDYKNSKEFKNFKNYIKEQKDFEKSVNKVWDQGPLDEYFKMKTVPWNWWWSECPGKIPCYNQVERDYNWWFLWGKCLNWCWANAFTMVLWYYNRRWLTPKIFTNYSYSAPNFNNNIINKAQWEISKLLLTECQNGEWWTNPNNYNIIKNYIESKWYNIQDQENYFPDLNNSNADMYKIFEKIKLDISNSKPTILYLYDYTRDSGHVVVAFWYSTKTWNRRVNVNFWWWKDHSNVNMDLISVSRLWKNYKSAWYFSFWIK